MPAKIDLEDAFKKFPNYLRKIIDQPATYKCVSEASLAEAGIDGAKSQKIRHGFWVKEHFQTFTLKYGDIYRTQIKIRF